VPLLLVAAIAGCGGDDEGSAETTREPLPDLSIPETDSTTEAAPEPAEPPPDSVDPATETLPPEGPEPPPEEEPPADTPENDAPPPEDTPAERFEEYCNENPGACG
jgi:hypothetical protein